MLFHDEECKGIHDLIKCWGDESDTIFDYVTRSVYDDNTIEWISRLFYTCRELTGAYAKLLMETGKPLDKDIEKLVTSQHFGYFEHPKWRELMEREYRKD